MALEKLKPQTGQRSVKRMFQRTLMVLFGDDHFDDDFHGLIRVLWIFDDGGNELGLSGTDGTCG